ncbi:MAG: AAA family ATPase [Planctomycetes bacterium]|nr:AAA family ATPase [Planctomycetota bacterium]
MLQEIEIQRFKSFESVRLELAPLTLLVGPNASGKSNFFDARECSGGSSTTWTKRRLGSSCSRVGSRRGSMRSPLPIDCARSSKRTP